MSVRFKTTLSGFLTIKGSCLFAAESALPASPVEPVAFVKMFIGLIITIGVIFLLAWLGRKTRLIQNFNSGYQIKPLASMSLTQREKLCLVEVGDKHILVGVAPGHIQQIHVFDEPVSPVEADTDNGNKTIFANQLKQALGLQSSRGDK